MTIQLNNTRKGCHDIWNAFMCEGAKFSNHDIPFCPTTATSLPEGIILWDEAKRLYRKALARKDTDFFCNSFVCFYMDDYKFDGARGIWNNSAYALKVLRHFAGVITPDFSTYQDFPEPLKIYPELFTDIRNWLIDRKRFEEGLEELVRVLQPHTIIVYGSANYPCFDRLIEHGIKVASYPSQTASAFERRRAR